MTYSAIAIANAFLELAESEGKRLTNMQLQKLVYIAHGYSLATLNKPLFYNNVHAFEWGPVIPKLYKKLSSYGAGSITGKIATEDESVPQTSVEMNLINQVWKAYGNFSGPKLSAITHRTGTPWSLTWSSNRFGVIDNEIIAEHYRHLLNEQTV